MDLLLPHTGTVIWMLIAFLSVLFILKKFAWKPILKALKERENSIKEALMSAENAKEQMSQLQEDNKRIIDEAKADRDKIIKEAQEIKDKIIGEAKDKATSEANQIIESARKSIEAEKKTAIKDIKQQAAELSVFIAEKILREKLSDDKSRNELINKYLDDVNLN